MASISAILSSVIGSSSVFGEAWQLHPNQQIRWPPQGHGVLAPDSPTVAPARRSPTISTTSVDTNQSECEGLISAGPAGGEPIEALEPLVGTPGWAHPALVPTMAGPTRLANPSLIL